MPHVYEAVPELAGRKRKMSTCPICLIEHPTAQESKEMHEATARIHAWLRSWMRSTTESIPVPAPRLPKEQRPNPLGAVRRFRRYNYVALESGVGR